VGGMTVLQEWVNEGGVDTWGAVGECGAMCGSNDGEWEGMWDYMWEW
jgi:hypothetical protein